MARKPASRPWRIALALVSWVAVATAAEGLVGPQVAGAVRRLEERIELRIKRVPVPDGAQPARSHEDEPFEPWELVSV